MNARMRAEGLTSGRGAGGDDNVCLPSALSEDPLAGPREDLESISLELSNRRRSESSLTRNGDQDSSLSAVVEKSLAVPRDEREVVVLCKGEESRRVDVHDDLRGLREVDSTKAAKQASQSRTNRRYVRMQQFTS